MVVQDDGEGWWSEAGDCGDDEKGASSGLPFFCQDKRACELEPAHNDCIGENQKCQQIQM